MRPTSYESDLIYQGCRYTFNDKNSIENIMAFINQEKIRIVPSGYKVSTFGSIFKRPKDLPKYAEPMENPLTGLFIETTDQHLKLIFHDRY
jgi:hypothetical protein